MVSKLQVQQQYKKRQDTKGFLALGRDVLFLLGAWWMAAQWGYYWWLSLGLIWFVGGVQFAIGESLLHEASHGNLFKTPWLNKLVGNLIAYSIFTTLSTWREEHSTHHRQLLTEADHLTQDYKDYQLEAGLHPFLIWIARPLLGWVGVQWLKSELSGLWKHKEVLLFYATCLGIAYCLNGLDFFLLYWFLPLCWAYPAILYWSEITDHYLSPSITRTNTSFFWNFFFHNGGYHWVHHEYPFIPWYLLPEANAALAPASVEVVRGWWGMYGLLLKDMRGTT